MKRLSETGLIEHVPYRGVQLTPQGRRAALQMIRRHRILESYLTSKLGYDWGDVHAEAERLEHAVSEKLIGRMAEALDDDLAGIIRGVPLTDAIKRIEASPRSSSTYWRNASRRLIPHDTWICEKKSSTMVERPTEGEEWPHSRQNEAFAFFKS